MLRKVRKPPGPTAKARAKRARASKANENANKQLVRARDVRCRFPLCRCRLRGDPLHVSHQRHKGMGGNPAGDRSLPAGMMLLCAWRHREAPVSIDRGTLRWRPLTLDGAGGPVAWDAQLPAIPIEWRPGPGSVDGWITIAVGVTLHQYYFEPWQATLLDRLTSR
jgi:hypothetical protein